MDLYGITFILFFFPRFFSSFIYIILPLLVSPFDPFSAFHWYYIMNIIIYFN